MNKICVLLVVALLSLSSVNATEFAPATEYNKVIIDSLTKGGADLEAPHLLEHHFSCNTTHCIESLKAKAKSLGYVVKHTGNSVNDGTHYWFGDLIKATLIDLDIINNENKKMLKIASETHAYYGGWGTFIIKK